MITRQEIENIYEIVQELYLAEDIPWVIGYSGGKDSTATLQLVWYALKKLPDELQEVIIFHYFRDLKLSEIAELLQVGLPLVKYRIQRARLLLKNLLKED